jgi:hypothetical protein
MKPPVPPQAEQSHTPVKNEKVPSARVYIISQIENKRVN